MQYGADIFPGNEILESFFERDILLSAFCNQIHPNVNKNVKERYQSKREMSEFLQTLNGQTILTSAMSMSTKGRRRIFTPSFTILLECPHIPAVL